MEKGYESVDIVLLYKWLSLILTSQEELTDFYIVTCDLV